jgi:Bacterial transcriptional activator domain
VTVSATVATSSTSLAGGHQCRSSPHRVDRASISPVPRVASAAGRASQVTNIGPVGRAIVTRPPGYVLVADPASIDAQRFESDYRAARSVWSTDPARAGALLDDALRLWRGPAYGAFADGFAAAAAARLEELRVSALEDRAALFVRAGAATDARRVRQCASSVSLMGVTTER